MSATAVEEYVKSGEHLPEDLRDFHDQKLFFKWLVWEKLEGARKKMRDDGDTGSNSMLHGLDFVKAQIFTVDYFLWFMAMFGFKLQRIRKQGIEFYDLPSAMRQYQDQLMDQQARALQEGLSELRKQKEI